MFRDKGPMHNLGHGVNSNDLPSKEGETETPSPNSGYIAKALDAHPMMRFFASAGTAMLATTLASRLTKSGGLKLGQALQKASDRGGPNSMPTRLVKGVLDLRAALDELQGVSRTIDGVDDPYSKVVFEVDGKLTTGYEGQKSERFFFRPLSQDGRRTTARGLTSESAEAWTYRDELQKRLVRAARRMPYELPALYVTQRAVTDPLFGENQDRKKVNWYNPADVISDFVKQSVTNVATMVLPFEALSAAGAAGKSSLTTLANSMNDLRSLSPVQKKVAGVAVDLKSLLAEVGHDASDIINKGLKLSSQTSGAFATGIQSMRDSQPEFVQALRSARHGAQRAAEEASNRNAGKFKQSAARARGFFVGDGQYEYGALDLIPSLKGLGTGFESARNNFKALGIAHDVVSGRLSERSALYGIVRKFDKSKRDVLDDAIDLNASLNKIRGIDYTDPARILERAINQVQSQHSSNLTNYAQGVYALGKGGPGSEDFKASDFYGNQLRDEYKNRLAKDLVQNRGVSQEAADSFVAQINVTTVPSKSRAIDVTKRITIGRKAIKEDSDDFFDTIIDRFSREVKNGKNFAEAIGSGSVLKQSIEEVDSLFLSEEFRRNLDFKIKNNWNSFYRGNFASQAAGVLKPAKQSYSDFVGDLSEEKKTYLVRQAAKDLGIQVQKSDGKIVSTSVLESNLLQKGMAKLDSGEIDTSYLRDFLLNRGKISTGFFSGGSNLFGLRPLLVDEGIERGLFRYLPESQQATIRQIASAQATFDPLTGGLGSATETMGRSTIRGVYQTRGGQILDFTKVTSMLTKAKDFFASEFRIPIVGFNPADLLGYRSMSDIRRAQPIQYVSARSVQPFLGETAERPDFYIFNRTKSTRGTLTAFSGSDTGQRSIRQLPGLFRSVPSASTEIISRETRNAAGLTANRLDSVDQTSQETGLNKLLGARSLRLKKFFDVDPEQPNSLFRLGSRFAQRKSDIRNPIVLSNILSSPENKHFYKSKGREGFVQLRRNAQNNNFEIYDSLKGKTYGQSDVLSAVDQFRKTTFNFNINNKIMRELEDLRPDLFTVGDLKISRTASVQDIRHAVESLRQGRAAVGATLRRGGIDPRGLTRSFSRLERYAEAADFPLERAQSELFRYVAQQSEMLLRARTGTAVGSTTINQVDDVFTVMAKTVRQMQKGGRIGLDEATEAEAFATATLFNFSSFLSYKSEPGVASNAKAALEELLSITGNNPNARNLFSAFSSGKISMINSGIPRPLSRAIPSLAKRFAPAPYEIDDLSVNVLGTGQQYTFVPTFGTAFARDPFGAVKSALGFGTYTNQNAFSTGSVPVSHMFGRLNKYFGTFGLQLDQSKYSGPMDLYARGMVGKRVLPITVGGAAFFTADRTLGGFVNERDEEGNRVYSPVFTTKLARGAVEVQSLGAGLVPGGMSYDEKRDQLLNGEVPIRQGRYWPLGTTPFEGGKVLYYRPSYYRKLKEGSAYTPESAFESPMEKLLFGYDFSPLRPFDSYRFERENYRERPYPVTGEYFTGPYGPMVPFLNMTVGKLLKPQMQMHSEETAAALANYVPTGEAGAFDVSPYMGVKFNPFKQMQGVIPSYSGSVGSFYNNYTGSTYGRQPSVGGLGGAGTIQIGSYNSAMSAAAGPMATAANTVTGQIGSYNQALSGRVYGPPKLSGVMTPPIVPSGEPTSVGSFGFSASELGYRLQETAGIYGFAFGSLREGLGFGSSDFEPQRAALQSASKGYGTTRAFWDLNLGGMGDIPLAGEGSIGNIEISEIVRRFIPKERTGINYINPIQNLMGQQYPFLPGPEYYINFTTGDPYTKVQEGELRLPGTAYERFNRISSDETGRYGRVNQLDILADVAPYSSQFRSLNRQIQMGALDPADKIRVQQIRAQAEEMTTKYQFSPYKYKGTTPEEMDMNPRLHMINRAGEFIAHRDTFFNTKFLNKRTAVEDWERRNVYGSTFPEWQRPFESFIEPMINRASQRDPFTATTSMAVAGALFGRTPQARIFGSIVGGTTGLVTSIKSNISEAITGERTMPETRKKEIALEEYIDILSYVKNTSLAAKAEASGNSNLAASYKSAAKRTMYGADIYGGSLETLSLAIPKRKREHFKAMINAPVEERERILSTAGRLERRIYQAQWGMEVEEKPDLQEYFTRHELPDLSWEGWHPNTNLEHVKIKMGQQMGLEMSQMGYYPQQIREANLVNPSYPSFTDGQKQEATASQLRIMMSRMGVSGSVTPVVNPYGSNSVNVYAGVR